MTKTDPAALVTLPIVRLREGRRMEVDDQLVVEEPMELRLGYTDSRQGRVHKSIAITMRTPGDDVALGLGFLFAESIIRSLDEVTSIDAGKANVLRIELREDIAVDRVRLDRNFYTTSSCGMCGKASLETLSLAGFDALPDNHFALPLAVVQRLAERLAEQQPLFRTTGGNHGVALFNAAGDILLVKEDVGRHNALDKLNGTLLQQGRLPLQESGLLLSGRASFEMMQKALAAGCPMVLAVGAPSSLAVELAQEFNITLAGFVGERGCNIYHGAGRILS
jgi:FdhD protein